METRSVAIISTPQTAALAAPVFTSARLASVRACARRAESFSCSAAVSGRSVCVITRESAPITRERFIETIPRSNAQQHTNLHERQDAIDLAVDNCNRISGFDVVSEHSLRVRSSQDEIVRERRSSRNNARRFAPRPTRRLSGASLTFSASRALPRASGLQPRQPRGSLRIRYSKAPTSCSPM